MKMQMFLTPEEKIIEQLRTENAALKEQVARLQEELKLARQG